MTALIPLVVRQVRAQLTRLARWEASGLLADWDCHRLAATVRALAPGLAPGADPLTAFLDLVALAQLERIALVNGDAALLRSARDAREVKLAVLVPVLRAVA